MTAMQISTDWTSNNWLGGLISPSHNEDGFANFFEYEKEGADPCGVTDERNVPTFDLDTNLDFSPEAETSEGVYSEVGVVAVADSLPTSMTSATTPGTAPPVLSAPSSTELAASVSADPPVNLSQRVSMQIHKHMSGLAGLPSKGITGLREMSSWIMADDDKDECVGVVGADGWTTFVGCDLCPSPKETESGLNSVVCEDMEECKKMCLHRGYSGFVVMHGIAFFHARARSAMLGPARRRAVPRLGFPVPTLMVAPIVTRQTDDLVNADWVEAMELNLGLVRRQLEERRQERAVAAEAGDLVKVETIGKDIERMKEQQARLAWEIWQSAETA